LHLRLAGAPGERRPLWLLHSTPKSGWLYEPLLPSLGAGRVAVAPDTPGYGASDAPPAPASIEELAAAMLEAASLLADAGRIPPGPIDVLGYHTGSVIAAAMARLAPARVAKLVLVSLAAYPAEVRANKRASLADWPAPRADGGHLQAMWSVVDSLTDARMDVEWTHASVTENLRAGSRAPWGYDAVYRYDFEATLDALHHPVLVLNPEDDLFETTRASAWRLPQARYVELPGVGHGLFQLEAERIAGLVAEFLDG
jgi:pimeloyl-ACP methyl ester carboxylesterase